MKHLTKRMFALLLSASIVFSSVPVQNAYAEENPVVEENPVIEENEGVALPEESQMISDETGEQKTRAIPEWYYNDNYDGTIHLTTYNGEYGENIDLVIPDNIDGNQVKGWDNQIFKDKSFKTVTLPTTLKQDGYSQLFGSCGTIEKVIVPNNYTDVGLWFYTAGAIKSIEFQGGALTTISDRAFSGSASIETITGLENVIKVGQNAFSKCTSLKSIQFSNKLTSIGESAFENASGLEYVNLGGSITTLPTSLFFNCINLTKVTGTDKVTVVNGKVFYNCTSLTNVTLSDSLKELGETSFYGTAITDVSLPSTLATIGHSVFQGCKSLNNVTIAYGISKISMNMFNGCASIEQITLPDSITAIETQAFAGCSSLKKINLPDSIKTFGYGFLSSCSSLTSLTIPGTMRTVQGMHGCTQLKEVTLNEGITEIEASCFYGSQIEKIEIPASVTNIGDSAISWYDSDTHGYKYPVVYGYTNSYAHNYAIEKGIKFVSIGTVQAEEPGVYLSGNDHFVSSNEMPRVIKETGTVTASAVMGENVSFSEWEVKFIGSDKTVVVGREHYEIDDKNELMFKNVSDLSTEGYYQVTAKGTDSNQKPVTYTSEFRVVAFEMNIEPVRLFDGSSHKATVNFNLLPENVMFVWEVGTLNEDGEFICKKTLAADNTENNVAGAQCTLTKDKLADVWGKEPQDESYVTLRVSAMKGGTPMADTMTEVVYCEDVIEFPWTGIELLKGCGNFYTNETYVYVRNAKVPYGEHVRCEITDISGEGLDVSQENNMFKISQKTGTSDSGRITFAYKLMYSENDIVTGSYTADYVFKDTIYRIETVTVNGPEGWMVKGQTKTIKPIIHKQWVDEEGCERFDEIDISSSISVEWTWDASEVAKYATVQKNNDGTLSIKVNQGVTEGDVRFPLQVTAKDRNTVFATAEDEIALAPEYDQMVIFDVSTGNKLVEDNLRFGETKTIRPVAMKFTNDNPDGINLEKTVDVDFHGDTSSFAITDHMDGTYSIKRTGTEWLEIEMNAQVDEYCSIGRNITFDQLRFMAEYSSVGKEMPFVLFTDEKYQVTASTEDVANGLIWDWDFVFYQNTKEGGKPLYRIDIASGKDLKTVQLDGSKYTEHLYDRNVDYCGVELSLHIDGNHVITNGFNVQYSEPEIFVQAEGTYEELITRNFAVDKFYDSWIRTKDYPDGVYDKVEIRNVRILSGKDVVSLTTQNHPKAGEIYLFTILKEGTATVSYDIYYKDKPLKANIQLELKGVSNKYNGEIVSDKMSKSFFAGDSITLSPQFDLDSYSNEGYFFKESLNNVRLKVVSVCPSCNDKNCDGCTVTTIENQDGTVSVNTKGHECSVELELDVYVGDTKIDTTTEWVWSEAVHHEVYIKNEAAIRALKKGEAVQVTPILKRYDITSPNGIEVGDPNLTFEWYYNDDEFKITSIQNGEVVSWKIERLTSAEAYIGLDVYDKANKDNGLAYWGCLFDCHHADTKRLNAKEATCLEEGYSGAEVCKDCGYLVSTSSPIDKKPHEMTHYQAVAATCTEKGNVEYWSCATCNHNYDGETGGTVLGTVELAPLGHEVTKIDKVYPTYEQDGCKEHYLCQRETCKTLFWDKDAKSEIKNSGDLLIPKLVIVDTKVDKESFKKDTEVTVNAVLEEIANGNTGNVSGVSGDVAEKIKNVNTETHDIVVEISTSKVDSNQVTTTLNTIETKIKDNSNLKLEVGQIEFKQMADISLDIKSQSKSDKSQKTELGKLTELEKPVSLTFGNVDPAPKGMKYVVIRLHGEEVAVLETKYQNGTVSFETDKFSVYALALVPVEKNETKPTPQPGNPSSNTEEEIEKAEEKHVCVFDREVATEVYLNTPATTTKRATYFKSCVCTGKGKETFEYGDLLKTTAVKETTDTVETVEEVSEQEEVVTEVLESETDIPDTDEYVEEVEVTVAEDNKTNIGRVVFVCVAALVVVGAGVVFFRKKRTL